MEDLIIFLLEAQVYSSDSYLWLSVIIMFFYLVDYYTKKEYFKTLITTMLLFIVIQLFIIGVENNKIKNELPTNNSRTIVEPTIPMRALNSAIERRKNNDNLKQ